MSGADSPGRRANLGRGLSSLLGDSGSADRPASVAGTRLVPIGQIRANPDQPRRYFNPDALAELSASIAAKGILQPILVRPDPAAEGDFQIIAGERRWRAAQQAGVHDVPVVVRQLDDTAVLEIALIENIQRADLDAIEEAAGYQRLIQDFGRSQDEIAKAVGKSRSHIANLMRLLTLPPAVQAMVIDGRLSAGHARALINASDPVALAERVMSGGLNVRQTEALVRDAGAGKVNGPGAGAGTAAKIVAAVKDADTRALEAAVAARLGLATEISYGADTGRGVISFKFQSLEELDALLDKLGAGTGP
ncbi:MAG: ParB/RepB/Spo0J family partition protein [Pseudomonadota bacterium]|nr:ParB/RepB/Spo0J family partition protein [Pseudomonadota bacterium]